MAVKIRLQRYGKKDSAFFHLVVADGRAPRDGKFIEKLGTYNPNANPAKIDLNFDSTLSWLMKGAQPTDTCRAILSYKGVMMKKHLLEGMKKGALTEAQVEEKFNKWLDEKSGKILGKHDRLAGDATEKASKRHAAEAASKEAKAAKVAAKQAEKAAAAHAAREAALASAEAKADEAKGGEAAPSEEAAG